MWRVVLLFVGEAVGGDRKPAGPELVMTAGCIGELRRTDATVGVIEDRGRNGLPIGRRAAHSTCDERDVNQSHGSRATRNVTSLCSLSGRTTVLPCWRTVRLPSGDSTHSNTPSATVTP